MVNFGNELFRLLILLFIYLFLSIFSFFSSFFTRSAISTYENTNYYIRFGRGTYKEVQLLHVPPSPSSLFLNLRYITFDCPKPTSNPPTPLPPPQPPPQMDKLPDLNIDQCNLPIAQTTNQHISDLQTIYKFEDRYAQLCAGLSGEHPLIVS